MSKRRKAFSDEMRQAIEESGESRYAIGKATGIDSAVLCRFIQGTSGLSIKSLDALAAHLGWRLIVRAKRSSTKAGG